MHSITKNSQDDAQLRRMIERAFGADQVPQDDGFAHEFTHGWFNAAYRIDLRDGTPVALKIAPPAGVAVLTREHEMMRAELEAMRLVIEQTDVPVPAVLYADLSHEILDADYFFMDFIDADNFGIAAAEGRLTRAEIEAGFRDLGRLNREINQIVGPHFGPLLGEGFGTWREAFGAMFEDMLRDGEAVGIDLGWHPDQLRAVVADHADVLDDVTEPRLIEVDLWGKNSMLRDGRIVGIVDHERAIYGDPIMEAGLTSIDLEGFDEAEPFMQGYGMAGLTPSERARRRLYSIALATVMAVETSYRGHVDMSTYNLARECLDQLMAELGHTR